jgi:osmotically-inducible protein OsmY
MNIRLLLLPIALASIGLAGCEVTKQPDGNSKVAVSDEVAEGAKKAADTTADVASQVAMTAKIESTLRGAESLKIEDLNVDTVDKTITLKGYVDSEEQKAKAEQLTKDMAGKDYTVNNMLAVKSKV